MEQIVTNVKLVKDLHTTNVDQLHAYLQQHERHANEVRLMHEHNSNPLALVASHQLPPSTYQSHLHTLPNSQLQHHVSPYPSSQFVTPYRTQQFTTSQSTPLSITYPSNEYQSLVHHNVYSPQSSIPQLEYAPTTYQHQQSEFSQPDSGLIIPVFQKEDDPIDAINHMMSFLTVVVTSRYPTTNNQLRTSSNPRQQATIYDGKNRPSDVLTEKVRESKPKLYDGNVILKMDAIVIPDSDETLMLCEESHAYWKATSVLPLDPSPSSTTNKVEVPKEFPTVSMVNTSLKELKRHLAGFHQVVKERTTATTITKELKDIFNNFNQYLVDELADVQNHLESRTFKVKMNQVFSENERLLAQAIDHDIVKTVVNLSVNDGCETSFTTLEKHCITLEADSQLNQENFQQKNSVLDQNAPSFTQLFELSELRAQSQEKDTVIVKLKEQIKSLKGNVDVTYKQLYDSIKPKRVQSKEQCDALIKQVNIKSGEISDLNAKLQEQGLVIAALKNELRKLKGKALDKEATETHSVDPKVSKDNMEPITPKLLNKRTAHSSYIKHTQEEALVLRDIVEHVKANYPQDSLLESAFRYTKVIQDLLSHISRSCPSINNFGPQLVEVTPRKKDKKVRFAESLTSTENTKTDSTSNIVSNKRVVHSTGVRLSTSASGSQPSGNTRNDKIQQTPSSNSKNKVEAHPRNVKSSLNKRNGTVKGSASVQNSKKHDNSDYVCISGDDCMSSDNLCVFNSMNDVKFRAKPKKKKSKKESWKPTGKVFTKMGYIWRPTGRTFTIVGNACPLTRITTTNEVPSRKPIVLESESPKPVVNLVYSRKPRKNKNTESVSKTKVVQIVLWYLDSGCSKHMTGDRSQLTNFISKFLGTVKFGNDQVAKIMGYGDYQIGNVTILRVYYVEGLGHNLFSVGQFCDSNLEVAFRQHTCFIHNLEGVDLLTGSRGDNLYTLSLGNMMASSPICLLSKASKTKSWLWHRRLSHLNFGAINHLARHGLVRGLPKLKFEKDHLCSACALGKSSKKPHKPKSEDTNQEKLYLLHMDLCGPMRVASVNGKKYILVIVDDYSRFTWVKCLRSKDEAPAFIINFLKMIQVRLKETVRRIRTDNGTEFVNQTLREYYEKVGISHETSVARSPQQNGVVERRNRTLIEAARTMLIYAKAPLFLWAEAVATACYTQNRSMIRRRHGKTPYELLHDKPPDLSYLHVFGALCYPTNDSENLGKLQPKADIGIFIGYAPAFQIFNRRYQSRFFMKDSCIDQFRTRAKSSSSTPFVPPSRSDLDFCFQPMFDESLNPLTIVDFTKHLKSFTPIHEAVGTLSIIMILKLQHMGNVVLGIPTPEVTSDQSSSSDVIHTIVPPDHQVNLSEMDVKNALLNGNLREEVLYETDNVVVKIHRRSTLAGRHFWGDLDLSKLIDIRFLFIKEHVEMVVIELYFVNTDINWRTSSLKLFAEKRIRMNFLSTKLGMRIFRRLL
ncbi:retrovirus-related pol polyprotein from transposon TNT 1-94 [Tanacetum coccineum]